MVRRRYGEKTVDRLYRELLPLLKKQTLKVVYYMGFSGFEDEVMQEARILFYKRFEDYYENDKQYLKFIFICTKNKIRTMQKKEYTYRNRYANTAVDSETGVEENLALKLAVHTDDTYKLTLNHLKQELEELDYRVVTDAVYFGWSWAFKKNGVKNTADKISIKERVIACI